MTISPYNNVELREISVEYVHKTHVITSCRGPHHKPWMMIACLDILIIRLRFQLYLYHNKTFPGESLQDRNHGKRSLRCSHRQLRQNRRD